MSDNEYEEPANEDVDIPPMEEDLDQQHREEQPTEEQPMEEKPMEEPIVEHDMKEEVVIPSYSAPKAAKAQASSVPKPVPTDLTIESAWKEICQDSPAINWYLFGIDKKMDLTFKKAGNDGFEGFTNVLRNSPGDLYFGLLRVNSNDRGGSKRAKFVYVRFVGGSVGVMQKAKITPKLGKIGDAFPVKHMTYDLTEDLGNFTIETLAKEMLRVGGAHKPDSYEFGPNQIYQCK